MKRSILYLNSRLALSVISKMSNWKILHYTFKCCCFIATFALVGFWCYKYYLDYDISVVDFKSFFDTADDIYPIMSVCFEQKFNDTILQKHGPNINGSAYRRYLSGDIFDTSMTNIDYDSVSTNISDFMVGQLVFWKNGSSSDLSNADWRLPYHTYSGFIFPHIFSKCFGIEIGHNNINSMMVGMQQNIFEGGIRPKMFGLAIFFHYPSQLLRSFHTHKQDWFVRKDRSTFAMNFELKGMEVVERRNKRKVECIPDWKNYDNIILEKHLETVGCKSPYQNYHKMYMNRLPICENAEKTKEAHFSFRDGDINTYPPPCKEIETINYGYTETNWTADLASSLVAPWQNNEKDYFMLCMNIFHHRFKQISQQRAIDTQNLIGNAGGYIGLFLGLAIMQIPELYIAAVISIKRFYKDYRSIKSIEVTESASLEYSRAKRSTNESKGIDDGEQFMASEARRVQNIWNKIDTELKLLDQRLDALENSK